MEKAPKLNSMKEQRILQWSLLILCVISAIGGSAFSSLIKTEGWVQVSARLQVLQAGVWALTAGLAGLSVYSWLGGAERVKGWLQTIFLSLARLRWLLVLPLLALNAAFPVLMFSRWGAYFSQDGTRHAIFVWLAALLAVCIMAIWRKPWLESLVYSAFSLAVVYHLTTYFPHISNYPFSLWWSETTRYYMASTFFAERIYGYDLPWVSMHLTRYLIQAFPFLIPDSPLMVHRLWQVILRFTTPYITGYLVARYLKIPTPKVFGVFVVWAGLFFFQGPVFYHLIVVVMLVFLLVESNRFWRTMLMVAVISVYAGFSRINWVPMPGLMAAALYFLEKPLPAMGRRSVLRYLITPMSWVLVGAAVGFGAQQFWVVNSGNPEEIFYSSFSSYLLWDRLFSNPSYPIGILPHILLLSGPLLVYLILVFYQWRKQVHFIRWLALAGITGVLFAGGLVVSVKIGGGTNLHNMDVYLVLLLLIGAGIYFGRMKDQDHQPVRIRVPLWLKAVVLVMPIFFVITFIGRAVTPLDQQAARKDLARLQKYVDQVVAEDGEVLFISQRHLITFGLIKNVPLVHEHEKVLLQEMVMSQNESYLAGLGAELAEQRYAMIVTDHLPSVWKDPQKKSLAMENNVVLKDLVPLFTCAYEEHDTLLAGSLEILTPIADVTCVTN
jgi:hypothetical protein